MATQGNRRQGTFTEVVAKGGNLARPGKRRFTLIELLVVITIIAILASMLLPAMAQAKNKAKGLLCKNNQKQIMLAVFLYRDAADGYFPPLTVPPDFSPTPWFTPVWGQQLRETLPDTKTGAVNEAFLCPMEEVHGGLGDIGGNDEIFKCIWAGAGSRLNYELLLRDVRLGHPVSTVVLVDSRWKPNFDSGCWIVETERGTGAGYLDMGNNTLLCKPYPPRHENGNNQAYADGHVGWMTATELESNRLALFIP